MIKTVILFGLWLTYCSAQNYQLAGILSTLTDASGLPLIQYLVENNQDQELAPCLNDLQTYLSDLAVYSRYARKVSTSFGEFPDESVEFTWNAYDYGIMEQCLDVNEADEDDSPFSAHYCMAMTMLETLEIHVGTCWPSACDTQDVETISSQISILISNSTDPGLSFICQGPAPWDTDAIAVLTCFSVIAAAVLVATIYDLYIRKHYIPSADDQKPTPHHPTSTIISEKVNGLVNERYVHSDGENQSPNNDGGRVEMPSEEVHKMQVESIEEGNQKRERKFVLLDGALMAFSAAANIRLLMNAKPSRSNLGVLNGLRVISMLWIILLHCNLFMYGSKKLDNYYNVLSISNKFARMGINNGTFGVDTFFVIGGLLVTYTTLMKLTKSKGKMNWLMFYFHRYWRLTPALLGALALWISLGTHLAGQGYMLGIFYGYVNSLCKQTWWTYPLYINNLYPFPGNNNVSCMGWAWYLACDMQFYFISPLIIIFLYRKRNIGIALILSLTTLSIASAIGISWYYGINPIGNDYNDRLGGEALDVTYTKPYTRIQSYLVGMLVGYALYKTANRKINIPWWLVMGGWLTAFALGMTCVYGLYGVRNDPDNDLEQYQAVLWEGFSKFAWAISIAWICFTCIKGYGGVINSFLSWNAWIPLGRLTYCTYLIHPLVIYNLLMSGKALFHFGIVSFSYYFVGSVVFCYLAALPLTLLMEMPAAGLEKVFFRRT